MCMSIVIAKHTYLGVDLVDNVRAHAIANALRLTDHDLQGALVDRLRVFRGDFCGD